MDPKFPFISIYNGVALDILESADQLNKVSTLALFDTKETVGFDSDLNLWSYSFQRSGFKPSLLTKILANTFYNPLVEVQVIWEHRKQSDLKELKSIVNTCVEKDDDILTQFVEADYLQNKINESKSFQELLETLRKYVFDVEEESIWKELEEQGLLED